MARLKLLKEEKHVALTVPPALLCGWVMYELFDNSGFLSILVWLLVMACFVVLAAVAMVSSLEAAKRRWHRMPEKGIKEWLDNDD